MATRVLAIKLNESHCRPAQHHASVFCDV